MRQAEEVKDIEKEKEEEEKMEEEEEKERMEDERKKEPHLRAQDRLVLPVCGEKGELGLGSSLSPRTSTLKFIHWPHQVTHWVTVSPKYR